MYVNLKMKSELYEYVEMKSETIVLQFIDSEIDVSYSYSHLSLYMYIYMYISRIGAQKMLRILKMANDT